MHRFLLRFLLAFSLLLPRCSSPLYAQAVPARAVTIDRANNRLQQSTIKLPSGATLTVESGGTLTLSGSLGGTPTGGTLNLSNVTLDLPTVPITDGGTGATTESGARTNLGATTIGANIFTLTNPGAVTFLRVNADNTVTPRSAADMRSDLGAQASDADLDDLADGSLSGSKVGSGIDAAVITTGTLAPARGGVSYVYSEITTTAVVVTNSTTFTDTGLTVTLGVGTWDVEVCVAALSSDFAAAGCKIYPDWSGTATESGVWVLYKDQASADPAFGSGFTNYPSSSAGLLGYGSLQTATGSLLVRVRARVTVTVSGVLKIQIAQYAAVAAETASIGKNSFIKAVKVSD